MKALFGGLLLAVGALVAGLSGLCTILVIADEAPRSWAAFKEGLPIVLTFGGLPFVVGLALLFGGLRLLRSARLDSAAAAARDIARIEEDQP